MSSKVKNIAGEVVYDARSDSEAVGWFLLQGRRGDYLADTGECMTTVAEALGYRVAFNHRGEAEELRP